MKLACVPVAYFLDLLLDLRHVCFTVKVVTFMTMPIDPESDNHALQVCKTKTSWGHRCRTEKMLEKRVHVP